ncbi:MAG: hypothetical protein R3E02_04185 [Blastomonas sp.]
MLWRFLACGLALALCCNGQIRAQSGPHSSQGSAIQYDRVNGYSLAFVDADVRRVVDAVMGSMLGVEYSVDADVTGNVTLRTAQPVTEASLIPLLEQALATLGAAIVKRGTGYRIVLRNNARGLGPIVSAEREGPGDRGFQPSSPGYASEVIRLDFASAVSLVALIEEFLGEGIAAPTRDGTNSLRWCRFSGQGDKLSLT